MMVPVRCFTCGKVVGEHWEEFKARSSSHAGEEDPPEVLDDLGLNRYCCRRMLIAHKDLVDVVAPYQ